VRLEITRRAELAVRALAFIGRADQRVKSAALADELDTSIGFVPQVVGPLVKAGWVRSDPGPTGGYTSRVDPSQVSILQVIEAVDGATDVGRCVLFDRLCLAEGPCLLHVAWSRARAELLGTLDATPVTAPHQETT
jgi:Rrf2 family protein